MNVLDNIETITYKPMDTIKYSFPLVAYSYGDIYTLNTGDINKYVETFVVTYKNGVCHSVNEQPAVVYCNKLGSIISLTWCQEGKVHREQGLPAYIAGWGGYEYNNNIRIKSFNKINVSMMFSIDDQYTD